jgi:hypothetical protein
MIKKVFNILVQVFLSYLLSSNRVQFAQAKDKQRDMNITRENTEYNATKYYEKRKILKPSQKKQKVTIKSKIKERERVANEEKQAWAEYEKFQEDKAWQWKDEQELKKNSKAELPNLVEAPSIKDPVPKESQTFTPFLPEIEKIIQKDYENRLKFRQEKQNLKQQDIQSSFEKNLKDRLKTPLEPKAPSKKLDQFPKSPEIAENLPDLTELSDFLNASHLKKPFFSEYELPITAALILSGGLSMGNVTLSVIRHFIVKKGTLKEFVETVLQDPKFQFNLAIALIAPTVLLSKSSLLHFLLIKRFNNNY